MPKIRAFSSQTFVLPPSADDAKKKLQKMELRHTGVLQVTSPKQMRRPPDNREARTCPPADIRIQKLKPAAGSRRQLQLLRVIQITYTSVSKVK